MTQSNKEISDLQGNAFGNLAGMPFSSLKELMTLRGFESEDKLYRAYRVLEGLGYISSVRHTPTFDTRSTKRFFVTREGLEKIGPLYGLTIESLLKSHPVTSRHQRAFFRRLDPITIYYKLFMAIVEARPSARALNVQFPLSGSFDALAIGNGGFSIGIMRKGNTLPFLEFRKRFWAVAGNSAHALSDAEIPMLTLVIVPTSFDKRWIAERITTLYSARMTCAVATEYEALELDSEQAVWRLCYEGGTMMSLAEMSMRLRPKLDFTLPQVSYEKNTPPVPCSTLSKVQPKATHRRMLDVMADWPFLMPEQLALMLNRVNSSYYKRHLNDVIRMGLVAVRDQARGALALTDEGLLHVGHRDRTAIGAIRQKWGQQGTQSSKLVKELNHTHGINSIVSRIYQEHPGRIEALPEHAAARYYRIDADTQRLVSPDAALLLRLGGDLQTLLLEYEKRASRGGEALSRKALVWIKYYVFNDRQYIGNLSESRNPHRLDNEVTLFVVPTDGIRLSILNRSQAFLRKVGWTRQHMNAISVAVTTERELEGSESFLTDEIWIRLDDYQRRFVSPILSTERRGTPPPRR